METLVYGGKVKTCCMQSGNRSSKRLRIIIVGLSVVVALLAEGCKDSDSNRTESTVNQAIVKSEKSKDSAKTLKICCVANCELPVSSPETPELMSGEKVYLVVDSEPKFPGGVCAMANFFAKNLKYPPAALKANVTGNVFISFIVRKNGAISRVRILKGIGFGCDEEALRLVSCLPKWKPGLLRETAVAVKYNLPIKFKI